MSDREDLVGTTLVDRYHIVDIITDREASIVYAANDAAVGRTVAVEVLGAECCESPEQIGRFQQRARALKRLAHPNVAQLTDHGTAPGGRLFAVYERAHGEALEATIASEAPLAWPRAKRISLQLCEAIGAAHAEGIVHHNLRPEACVRLANADQPDFMQITDSWIGDGATAAVEYTSPERAGGEPVDLRADLYALGVILYQLVTGKVPYSAALPADILARHRGDPIPLPCAQNPELMIPAELDGIILRALSKAPDHRHQNAQELASAIRAVPDWPDPDAVREVPLDITEPLTITDGRIVRSHQRLRSVVIALATAALVLAGFVVYVIATRL